jgi:hypothetical protein
MLKNEQFFVTELTLLKQFEVKAFAFYVLQDPWTVYRAQCTDLHKCDEESLEHCTARKVSCCLE